MNFKKNETAQKLRGGYYTPDDLASFLTRWVQEIEPKTILEPSCGDGVFLRALGKARYPKNSTIRAFELDPGEANKARAEARASRLTEVRVDAGDFLSWAERRLLRKDETFDAVVGNPPFVRYQYLPKEFQLRAEAIFQLLRLPFTKHTNAWVPFVLASMALLRPGGRLAMVVPAEIIHVMHAQSLRSYLGEHCSRLVVVDPEELWFPETLQGAVLLMAEKKQATREFSEGLGIFKARGRGFTAQNPREVFASPQAINGKTVEGKWTRALLDVRTRDLLDDLLSRSNEVRKFGAIAEVDVGIVTGANKYFLVTDDVVRRYQLSRWAHPMFGRSEHCPGVVYDERQHEANAKNGYPTNFIWFNDSAINKHSGAAEYLRLGEQAGLPERYKCRVRKPWYTVPSVYATEIGMLKRAHDTPRLILNTTGAYTTDTAYRIRCAQLKPEMLVYCFMNGLTALSAELEGRHYGGGVLELVPSEIEQLIIPTPKRISINLEKLDRSVRTKPAKDVLERQSAVVLGSMGISAADQACLLAGWQKLRDRRQRVSAGEEN